MIMGVRKTQEQFLKEAYALHGDHYDFSKSVYTSSKDKMSVYCNIHHKYFSTTPNQILKGSGCPDCGLESRIAKRTDTTESFIAKARKVHGDKYDYSKVVYEKSDIPVIITCKKCGQDFKQSPNTHLMGHGCEACSYKERGIRRAKGIDIFTDEARTIWGEAYDYSSVVYKNSKTRVDLICPKHGVFSTTPYQHLKEGVGCPQCKRESRLLYDIAVNDVPNCNPKCLQTWVGMLHRCYYKKELERHPTYRGCTVCDEWLRLSGFVPFWEANYRPKYELEKDILVKGNKVYGPDTCCFVPRRINILFTNRKRFRGELPVGVSVSENGLKYKAAYDRNGKSTLIGQFDTPEHAFLAYKKAKEEYIKEVAQEYYNSGKIDKKVYEALLRYQIEITD